MICYDQHLTRAETMLLVRRKISYERMLTGLFLRLSLGLLGLLTRRLILLKGGVAEGEGEETDVPPAT